MGNDRVDICGIKFDNVTIDEAVGIIEKKISGKLPLEGCTSQLLVANQDIINRIKKDKSIPVENLNRSFLIIPDGVSIIMAAKMLGTPLKERVAGPDVMEKFMEVSNSKGYRNFFFGSKDCVVKGMSDNFKKKYKNLVITGVYSPPFTKKFSDGQNNDIIEKLNSSKSDIIWVSLGCPKQEKWILDNLESLDAPVLAGIGAAFDFHSGNLKRAPLWIRKIRMEWFYRFLQEPFRLWQRYFLGGLLFFSKVLMHKFRKKRCPARSTQRNKRN
jgi:N-acetylglucosaminyldiphosphoundecaprenol N-acetyl-beta-D-mannosaminyltransferase